MNAAKYGLNKVFFSGCFIRGELFGHRLTRLYEVARELTYIRPCSYHLHVVVCYPILVKGDDAGVFPATRGFLVSSLPCRPACDGLMERADLCRGAIGAWIKNVEIPEEEGIAEQAEGEHA